MTFPFTHLVLSLLGGVFLCAHAMAEEPESRFSLKGFGTLGLVRSDQDGAEYVRDLSQPHGAISSWTAKVDSVFGLQLEYDIDADWDAVAQAVSRYRYDNSHRPELTWTFLRYSPNAVTTLRGGRLGTEFYLLGDSRLVGYSQVAVRPPPDYFGTLVFSYFDGLDASGAWPLGEDALLRGKLFLGRSPETTPFANGVTWDVSGSRLLGGHLDLLRGPWQFRAGQARVRFAREMPLQALTGFDPLPLAPDLAIAGTWTRFDSLGLAHDQGALRWQWMWSRTRHESNGYEDGHAWFGQASYRLGEVTPYLGYSLTRTRPVSTAWPLTSTISAVTHTDQHTWFLGARWDFKPGLALKAQVDRIRGSPASVFPYRGDAPVWDGDMQVFSLSLDFVF